MVLTVADSGTGMTPEVHEHLFEPFFTTKEIGKGTGPGLSTVYGIVRQSGGHILVDTEAGRGTAFRIYLPRTTDAAEQPVPAAPSQPMPRGAETILLVEARDDVRSLASGILRDLGYTVLEAAGPARGIDLKAREDTGTIDLLLTNTVLSGMAATELVAAVKSSVRGSKVLLISSKGESEPPAAPPSPASEFCKCHIRP